MAATIKLGSSGPDVQTWQGLLTAAGFPVSVTGTFDAATDAATRAWQKARSLVSDGIVGPASWSAMTGQPSKSYPPYYAKNAQLGRDALREAWQGVTGEVPNLATLQIAQANAHLESGYGLSAYTNKQTGETRVLNNWGAVQAGPPPCGPGKFEATDTDNNGQPYQRCFRAYDTSAAGAADMIRHLTIERPVSWYLMRQGDIDAWAWAMHNSPLPSSTMPPPEVQARIDAAVAALGGAKHVATNRKIDAISGAAGYFAQTPPQRAKGVEERIWAIADTLNEPVAAKRGGPPSASDRPLVPTGTAGRGAVLVALAAAAYALWRWWRG